MYVPPCPKVQTVPDPPSVNWTNSWLLMLRLMPKRSVVWLPSAGVVLTLQHRPPCTNQVTLVWNQKLSLNKWKTSFLNLASTHTQIFTLEKLKNYRNFFMEDFQVRIILWGNGITDYLPPHPGGLHHQKPRSQTSSTRQCDSTLWSLLWADIKSYKKWNLPSDTDN